MVAAASSLQTPTIYSWLHCATTQGLEAALERVRGRQQRFRKAGTGISEPVRNLRTWFGYLGKPTMEQGLEQQPGMQMEQRVLSAEKAQQNQWSG